MWRLAIYNFAIAALKFWPLGGRNTPPAPLYVCSCFLEFDNGGKITTFGNSVARYSRIQLPHALTSSMPLFVLGADVRLDPFRGPLFLLANRPPGRRLSNNFSLNEELIEMKKVLKDKIPG